MPHPLHACRELDQRPRDEGESPCLGEGVFHEAGAVSVKAPWNRAPVVLQHRQRSCCPGVRSCARWWQRPSRSLCVKEADDRCQRRGCIV